MKRNKAARQRVQREMPLNQDSDCSDVWDSFNEPQYIPEGERIGCSLWEILKIVLQEMQYREWLKKHLWVIAMMLMTKFNTNPNEHLLLSIISLYSDLETEWVLR